jgi:hypothetical protein
LVLVFRVYGLYILADGEEGLDHFLIDWGTEFEDCGVSVRDYYRDISFYGVPDTIESVEGVFIG